MKKNYTSVLSILFILVILGLLFASMMPQWTSSNEDSLSEFSTKRAFRQLEILSKTPHFIGSENHEIVAQYLLEELKKLGLETTVQEGYSLSDWGNLVKSKNILTRIKGTSNTKSLLLLSHYDSAPHSYSHGASDDASGVATILESVRAFLYAKKPHKNDIIILFSDAEELGLNGAALFVTQHPWAKNLGLVLNFEARGSSGPSYMLMETNAGNAGLVKEFAAANATYPVSNSLMYSIYKMLPNDTDLTIFREQGNIQGYNFAFIDDHFNYHTAQDDSAHLDKKTLAHQGTYLMPLLSYFSNANLSATQSGEDYVYFTIPFTFISYSFSWILPMVILAFILLLFLITIGIAKRILSFKEIARGFIPFLIAIVITGIITFFGWKLLLNIYPQYSDLLNGFTYNGHAYIAGFVLLAVAISFCVYAFFNTAKQTKNNIVAPLFLWILINGMIAFALPGAGFLIIPVYFGLFAFGFYILTQKSYTVLNLICCVPALLIIAPFIQMFPIGLGLKVLFGSAILSVLTFGLLLPIFGAFAKKGIWSLFFLVLSIGFFATAHYGSGYELGKAKSNSLLYIYDADSNVSNWVTYDKNLDSWTKSVLGENPKEATNYQETPLFSKYNSGFTYAAKAPKILLAKPTIEFIQDYIVGNQRIFDLLITPNRKVNRYDVFANEQLNIYNFSANGSRALGQKGALYKRKGKKIISYYVVNNEPLKLHFSINANAVFDMKLLESSFDLVSNPLVKIPKRENWMMPTPFVLNDAVIIIQKITPSPLVVAVKPLKNLNRLASKKDTTTVEKTNIKPIN